MLLRAVLVLGLLGAALGGCARVETYDGPEVTRVVVMKSQRRMYLMHEDQVVAGYDTMLGFAPEGHKRAEGDGRTPEGRYRVDRRNPASRYHLALGIDYPRPRDVAAARAAGVEPGGDIFIHGTPGRYLAEGDWTAGCVAVSNAEMERIYDMVADGTPVDIFP
jgi:murein L,D-transpeptidase YafK